MFKGPVEFLARHDYLRDWTPAWLKRIGKKFILGRRYEHRKWERNNPFVGTEYEWSFEGSSENTLGIVFDVGHFHRYWMAACIDMNVSYRVVDISTSDWVDRVVSSGCSAVGCWPMYSTPVMKDMIDERLLLMEEILGFKVYPSPQEFWSLDNKRRVRDWLTANEYPLVPTWCFFKEEEALDFAASTTYPVVFKTTRGSVSQGVRICRTRHDAERIVRQCFGRGVGRKRGDPRDRQWGFALFQEYLEDPEEIRMIRVGDSFFCIRKIQRGEFHSGSGAMEWFEPKTEWLDLIRQLTNRAGYRCMNVDLFLPKDGRLLINELHAVFHGPRIQDNENTGRFTYESSKKTWDFQPGNYYRNYCTNLRVEDVLRSLGESNVINRGNWLGKPVWD
jgi:hypothetical protein